MGSMIQTCNCERCGRLCRVADRHTEDARILRKSLVPEGLCVNCAATQFFKTTPPLDMLLEQGGPDMLRHDHIRDQFAALLRVGKSDAEEPEIDWDLVVANWDLPTPGAGRGKRRR